MAQSVQLLRPAATQAARAPRVPYADTDIEASPQNTVSVGADAVVAYTRPRLYGNPSFMCSVFNIGPGAVSIRWDGQDTVFGAPDAILLPAGTGYAEAITPRFVIAADGSGATLSMSCEPHYGR